jgi:prepilin-type N-terminal cleavage/methylation domain-containing protein
MRTRLRDQSGMTLIEVLVSMSIGMLLVLGTLTLVDVTMRRSGEIAARVESVQSGRLAMDIVTREIRSQSCQVKTSGTGVKPVSILSATPDSLTMFVDLRDTSNTATPTPTPTSGVSGPDKRTLTFGSDGRLTENVILPSSVTGSVYAYTGAGTTRTLLPNVQRAVRKSDGATVPYFRYFRFDFTQDPATPTYELTNSGNPLTDDQLKSIAKITITYKANPAIKRPDGTASTVFTNSVFTRAVDPNADVDELSNPCT